ncbi:MAG: OmpH family outer membrane protein [Flavobacterium sp.]|nr:OmpH family outer membrane protein [Flavobacterium sp.]
MRNLKSLLIAAAFVFTASQTISAQSKIAHVDTNEIMSKMPAMLDAQKQLQTIGKTYEDAFKTMTTEYQTKLATYDKDAATAGDKVNEERAKEVQEMQKRITDYRDNAQKELQTKEGDLTKPIYEKVKVSIKKVAKLKGFQYVLNADGLLVADGPDLTADVKKDLGF